MSADAEPVILAQESHRNGVCGREFVVSLLTWPLADAEHGPVSPFVAVSFMGPTRADFVEQTAVLSVSHLVVQNLSKWRGADYLGEILADAWRVKCLSNGFIPYDPFSG